MRLRPAGGNQWTHIGCGTESLLVCFLLAPKAYYFDQLETLSVSLIIAYLSRLVSRPQSSSLSGWWISGWWISGWWISGSEAEATS